MNANTISRLRLVSVIMVVVQIAASILVLAVGLPLIVISLLLALGAVGSAGPGVLRRFYGVYAAEDMPATKSAARRLRNRTPRHPIDQPPPV
jgi:hypothetical protein